MAGRAESLNVGMACAVLCFEAPARSGGIDDAEMRPALVDDAPMNVDELEREAEAAVAEAALASTQLAEVVSSVLGKRGPLALGPPGARRSSSPTSGGRPAGCSTRRGSASSAVVAERRRAARRRPNGRPGWPPTGST